MTTLHGPRRKHSLSVVVTIPTALSRLSDGTETLTTFSQQDAEHEEVFCSSAVKTDDLFTDTEYGEGTAFDFRGNVICG
jgi:hypothetical protein